MCRTHNRAEKRRMEKLEASQTAAALEAQISLEEALAERDQYRAECNRLRKHVQLLQTRLSRVPDEMKACECGDADPRASKASRTGFVCYNCGGECA